MGRYDFEERQHSVMLILVAIVFLIIIALGVAWLFSDAQKLSDPSAKQVLHLPIPQPEKLLPETDPTLSANDPDAGAVVIEEENTVQTVPADVSAPVTAKPLPTLADSDVEIRTAAIKLSAGLSEWLMTDQLLRKLVVMVNDFAQNLRPYRHFKFFKLAKPFTVSKDEQGMYIDKASYQRYDRLAAAVNALDVDGAMKLFQRYRPLIQQVFDEFGYPDNHRLEDIFVKALANIMQAPIVDGKIRVYRPTVRYKFTDAALEKLNPVQKQLLRMGPENTRKIQNKCRQLLEKLVVLTE